ncbi:MAG: hypothetical protein HY720_08435, partial [Planctomycetes bacterium]|nr:hypothetical protein [Planctomycetota bacterium]
NPDYMPNAWFHEKDGKKWFHIGDVYLADKCYVEKQPPELALRSHGFYEITSLGMVYNPAGEQIASRIVATAIRSYYPIRHSTQKNFMSKPSGTSWKTGEPYPSAPWTDSDVTNWAVNTTTFPENIWDNRNGSQTTSEPGKADPWTGGVELTPMDDPVAGATFFTNYRHHIEANPPTVGDRQYYLESNTRDAYATSKTLQDRSVHNASTTQGSDLFPDGLYHNQWRRWRATVYKNGAYNVASYQKMRPDQGTLEMWYKIETHWFGGEIFTAFQPCVSTFAQQPSEGIQHRVYLGYVPFRCGFGGCAPVDQPYRWHGSPEVQSSRGVLCVPVICAERLYYTASIELSTGRIYGRDAGYQNRRATGFFNINGSVVQLASANFVDYEYFPLLNWGRDKMWHHLYTTWRAGTDIEFYMDGVRAPYRTTVTNTAYGQGQIVLPWYGYNDMQPEIHVGGTRKFEVPQRMLSLGPGFAWSAPSLSVVWPKPLRYWYDFTPSGPTDWKADGTLDWIRIFQAAGAGARRNRFEPISGSYVGAYRNQIKMPQDATRIVYMSWNEQIPTWNPAIDPGPYYYGRYIYPNQRPDVILELRTAAGTWRFDEPTLQAAPFNMTAEQARKAAHGSGVPLNAIVQPGEVVTYTAYFRNSGNVTPLQVTPILEDVTLFYFTKAPATFFWEEY